MATHSSRCRQVQTVRAAAAANVRRPPQLIQPIMPGPALRFAYLRMYHRCSAAGASLGVSSDSRMILPFGCLAVLPAPISSTMARRLGDRPKVLPG